jgi:hypothetical protein
MVAPASMDPGVRPRQQFEYVDADLLREMVRSSTDDDVGRCRRGLRRRARRHCLRRVPSALAQNLIHYTARTREKQIKRSPNVVRTSANDVADIRLVGTILAEQYDDWQVSYAATSPKLNALVIHPPAERKGTPPTPQGCRMGSDPTLRVPFDFHRLARLHLGHPGTHNAKGS